jgi:hypothetical protein
VEGGRHDLDVEGGRHDIDVEGGRHDLDVEGGRHDIDVEGGRHDIDVEGGRHDIDVEGAICTKQYACWLILRYSHNRLILNQSVVRDDPRCVTHGDGASTASLLLQRTS